MSRRASETADMIRVYAGKNWSRKTQVAWTSKHGDVSRFTGFDSNQSVDSSDIYLRAGSWHLGVSLKSIKNKMKNPNAPISNGGRGDMDYLLGVSTNHHLEAARNYMISKYNHLDSVTAAEAKAFLKSSKIARDTERKSRSILLTKIAYDYAEAFQDMEPEDLAYAVRRSMRALDTGFDHIRVTSTGEKGDYNHKLELPVTQHNHILYDYENIIAYSSDFGVQFEHVPTETKFHRIRLKATDSSGLFGPIKTSGENQKINI
jgi:hypothetical protein